MRAVLRDLPTVQDSDVVGRLHAQLASCGRLVGVHLKAEVNHSTQPLCIAEQSWMHATCHCRRTVTGKPAAESLAGSRTWTVDSLCAMTSTVRPCTRFSTACRTACSLSASRLEVASSSRMMGESCTWCMRQRLAALRAMLGAAKMEHLVEGRSHACLPRQAVLSITARSGEERLLCLRSSQPPDDLIGMCTQITPKQA